MLDEPDDSFDEFIRFDFQDGEALGEGETATTPSLDPAVVVSAASTDSGKSTKEDKEKEVQKTGQGRGAGARTKAPHEFKKHHQKDRALRERGVWI